MPDRRNLYPRSHPKPAFPPHHQGPQVCPVLSCFVQVSHFLHLRLISLFSPKILNYHSIPSSRFWYHLFPESALQTPGLGRMPPPRGALKASSACPTPEHNIWSPDDHLSAEVWVLGGGTTERGCLPGEGRVSRPCYPDIRLFTCAI